MNSAVLDVLVVVVELGGLTGRLPCPGTSEGRKIWIDYIVPAQKSEVEVRLVCQQEFEELGIDFVAFGIVTGWDFGLGLM